MRILITGSRTWDDEQAIYRALKDICRRGTSVVVVHGACPSGADATASYWARAHGMTEERHPADWKRLGKRAGFARNAEMVNLGADVCLAFIRDNSRGASHTADLAEKAGIPTRRWTA